MEPIGTTAMRHKELDLGFDHPAVRLATVVRPPEIDVQRQGSHAVLRLCDSGGIGQVDPLREALYELASKGVRLVVLDLHDLDFIGSAGLAAIVSGYLQMCGYQQSRHHQSLIKLAAPDPGVLDVMRRARPTELFPVYDSIEQAMA